MLSMRTAVYGFVKDYLSKTEITVDEYRLRAEMVEKDLSHLVVAPKEIDFLVNAAAGVIATAINRAFHN